MRLRKNTALCVLLVACIGFVMIVSANIAYAALSPKYYEKATEESKIKATAIVKSVKVLNHHRAVDYKKVTFSLIKSFGPEKAPEKFTGRCESVNRRWLEKPPIVGPAIYYYPKKNEKVYVTIAGNDGAITSYTKLTPELEKSLDKKFKSAKGYIATSTYTASKNRCPECGASIKELPVVYGYPSAEMLEMQERGEIILGGCVVGQDPGYRIYGCAKCSWKKREV